ncbi:MAG: DUF6290 family protein [Lachnospiraceae bacterium]|nr:DUF6290 family protein [Lachnospiraceae bacterium]
MVFSIRLNPEEKKLANEYAKLNSMSIAEAFKSALFDKIEDEYNLKIYNEAYDEYVKSGKKSRPIGELWKELGL